MVVAGIAGFPGEYSYLGHLRFLMVEAVETLVAEKPSKNLNVLIDLSSMLFLCCDLSDP